MSSLKKSCKEDVKIVNSKINTKFDAWIMNQQNHAFEILGENLHKRWETSSNNGICKMINNLSTLLSTGEVLVAFLVQSWVIHFTCDIGVSPGKNNQNHI